MKSQHTPGPWHVAKLASPAYLPEFGIYAEGAPRDLARVMGENSAADAALIAGAPRLLRALQSCHRYLRKSGYDMTEVNAAIYEAEGEAP